MSLDTLHLKPQVRVLFLFLFNTILMTIYKEILHPQVMTGVAGEELDPSHLEPQVRFFVFVFVFYTTLMTIYREIPHIQVEMIGGKSAGWAEAQNTLCFEPQIDFLFLFLSFTILMTIYWEIFSTFRCPTHSCRNVQNLLESIGMRLESAGITAFLQEWNWNLPEWVTLNKISYSRGALLI